GDASAIELIDRVRRNATSRDVPILIYTRPEPRLVMQETLIVDNAADQTMQAPIDDTYVIPDQFGVFGGIENIEGVIERDLLAGDLDADLTILPPDDSRYIDIERLGRNRWGNRSRRAGLIRYQARPLSISGLYEFLTMSRLAQHLPPLSAADRTAYRRFATNQLDNR
ncbi:MAG: hypothetical protein AAF745_19030, partial [Planctomycetota bacterium]